MAVRGANSSFVQAIQGGAFESQDELGGTGSPKDENFRKGLQEKKENTNRLRRFTKRAGTILSFTSALK